MTASGIIEGLEIINRHKPPGADWNHVKAEHGSIYAGSLEWKMTKKKKELLEYIGWVADEKTNSWRADV